MLYLLVAVFFLLFQDLFIFPKLKQKFFSNIEGYKQVPEGIRQFYVETKDGQKLDVWTSLREGEKPDYAAIIFHGNAETVESRNFLPFFRNLGIPAFIFDYRGYGKSSGWPTEAGLYLDSEAVHDQVLKVTALDSSRIILLGNSIGTGPAAYLASKINPAALLLIAAYHDLPSLVLSKAVYAPFAFVLRYKLPVYQYVQSLQQTCIVLAHGRKDTVIPFEHSQRIIELIKADELQTLIESSTAGHNDIFFKVEDRLSMELSRCLSLKIKQKLDSF